MVQSIVNFGVEGKQGHIGHEANTVQSALLDESRIESTIEKAKDDVVWN